jgi:hypothetical protein
MLNLMDKVEYFFLDLPPSYLSSAKLRISSISIIKDYQLDIRQGIIIR